MGRRKGGTTPTGITEKTEVPSRFVEPMSVQSGLGSASTSLITSPSFMKAEYSDDLRK
jgi:hypothetical protein